MEDNSDCLSAMETELGSQCQSLNDIHNQLMMMLITLSGGVNPHVEAPPAVTNAVVAPPNPLNTIGTYSPLLAHRSCELSCDRLLRLPGVVPTLNSGLCTLQLCI